MFARAYGHVTYVYMTGCVMVLAQLAMTRAFNSSYALIRNFEKLGDKHTAKARMAEIVGHAVDHFVTGQELLEKEKMELKLIQEALPLQAEREGEIKKKKMVEEAKRLASAPPEVEPSRVHRRPRRS